MPRPSIYWSEAGRRAVRSWYEDRLADFPVPVESTFVDTRFGPTHVLRAGPVDGPPLVVLHGLDLNAAAMVGLVAPLAGRRRVLAIDTIGDPGLSAEVRPRRSGPAYADWLADVLDGLGLDGPVDLAGFSFGGWIILKLASYNPGRIARLALIGGGGLTWLRLRGQLVMAGAMLRHFAVGSGRSLRAAVRPLYGPGLEADPHIARLLGLAFRHVRPDPTLAWLPPHKPGTLDHLPAPAFVCCGVHDVFFDAHLLIDNARRLLPGLRVFESLPGQGHIPDPDALLALALRIEAFLDAGAARPGSE
ncbi:alpha/beta fold hydrolase [Tautonia plasticadhaerens]|uniref:Carboxylesterase YbfK n=1 Tax=Tautonia plasticadhaerens TaxID=2527974 RepID=A0A518HD44_9BACT|nr:alpha/beta hydrolase [Tautonia plasticadhaerens]QDV38785.1 Carboxylesterase YbfK [Tautonia plasticadhaerens]